MVRAASRRAYGRPRRLVDEEIAASLASKPKPDLSSPEDRRADLRRKGGRRITEGDPVQYLDLSDRLRSMLTWHGFYAVEQLVAATPSQLLRIKGFGPKSLEQVVKALRGSGLKLSSEGE